MESVVCQTFNDIEIIVQDGASCDGTAEWVGQTMYDHVKFISEKDSSIYDAMNRAIDRVCGQWLLFLNAGDTFASQDALEIIERHADICPDKHLLACDVFVNYGNYMRVHSAIDFKAWNSSYRQDMPTAHQGILYPRNVIAEVGKFDTDLKICSDYDHFRRCLEAGYKWTVISKPLIYYDVYGIGNRRFLLNLFERVSIIKRYDGRAEAIKVFIENIFRMPRIALTSFIRRTCLYDLIVRFRKDVVKTDQTRSL